MQTENQNDLTLREKQVTREQGTRQGPYFEPPVDIYETEEALVVTADLPGVDASDVQTDRRDNLLTITAPTRPVDPKWKAITDGETMIVHVVMPKAEEEPAAATPEAGAVAAAPAEPEVIKKGKTEEKEEAAKEKK